MTRQRDGSGDLRGRDFSAVFVAGVLSLHCGGSYRDADHAGPRGPCDVFDDAEGAVWNDATRTRVLAGLTSVGPPYAERTAKDVVRDMNAAARQWTSARKAACAAGPKRAGPSMDPAAEAACYEAALRVERAAVEALGRADRTALATALDVVDDVTQAVARCQYAPALAAFAALHETSSVAEDARRMSERARMLLTQGDLASARREATRAETLGTGAALRRVVADARLVKGRSFLVEGRLADARIGVEDARTMFSELRDDMGVAAALRTEADLAARAGKAADEIGRASCRERV